MSAAPLPACSPAADVPLDDLLLEVFLRLPPEPGHLLAASLVCRRWRRLVRSRAFLRRFRALHGSPPVLGFFQNQWFFSCRFNIDRWCTEFVTTVSSLVKLAPPEPELMRWVLDCRHGRVLLDSNGHDELFVWDPMTGEVRRMSTPTGSRCWNVRAAVVCADEHGDHTDCHYRPFSVVFLDDKWEDGARRVSAYVYCSETSAWSHEAAMAIPSRVSSAASAFVGNSVYWKLLPEEEEEEEEEEHEQEEQGSNHILEFDLARNRLALIELPDCVRETYKSDIHVMPAEDGGIGFAAMCNTCIHLWSTKIEPGWVMLRMIDMGKLTLSGVPIGDALLRSSVDSFAEGTDELFLTTDSCVFTINLRSMQLRRVADARASAIYPYTSFYTRGRDIAGIDDRADD